MMRFRKSTIIACLILLFPIAHLIASNLNGVIATAFSYYDEIVGCMAMLFITVLLVEKKLSAGDQIIYGILWIITFIGIVSNILSGVERTVFSILVDIIFLWKPIACYLAFKYCAMKYRERIIRTLYPWAKFAVILNFVLSVAGKIVNIGVYGNTDGAYIFFWNSTYQTAWLIIAGLLIIAANCVSEKDFIKYLIMAIFPLFFIEATMVWSWIIVEISLIVMLGKNKTLKKRYIVFLGAVIFGAFFSEVSYYLFSRTGPRAKLIRGALEVAAEYFPLGSGFATYGSEMASRYYSPIYVAMGWEYSWGLGVVYNQYINDNFFACILAQFGWIGFIVYLVLQLNIFNQVNTVFLSKMERATAISTLLIIVASMIGSASAKSAMGVFVFSVLGVLAAKTDKNQVECNGIA